ncbi:MAG: NfeD family protein [Chitinophagaceae bacterium]|nr:MAG: NfeD family protein [Chitinophagaceae bacterium]
MEAFENISVIWFVIGLAFFLLEFVIPGFILFFFGIGAWIVGVTTLFADISLSAQLAIFLISSIATVAIFRKWVKKRLGMNRAAPSVLEDEFVGKTALCLSAIAPGANGKIEFKGASWDAASTDHINAGETVIITGNQSILLIVRSTKTI